MLYVTLSTLPDPYRCRFEIPTRLRAQIPHQTSRCRPRSASLNLPPVRARANFFRLFGDSPSLPAPRLVSVHRPAPATPAYFLLVRVVLTLQGSLAKDYFTGGLTAGKCSSSFAPKVVNSSKQIKQTNNGTLNKSSDVPYQFHPTLTHSNLSDPSLL